MKLKKAERRQAIQKAIELNPFITDSELCEQFEVSIQTIRLDRTNIIYLILNHLIHYFQSCVVF